MPSFWPPPCVATGAVKHANHKYHTSLHAMHRPINLLLAPSSLRTLLWERLTHMLAALLRAAASLLQPNSTSLARRQLAWSRKPKTLPPAAEHSLALLLHMAPTCAGRWEHLVSPATLNSLPSVEWQPRGHRSGVEISLCPARAHDDQPLHKVRGEGHIAAPADKVLALVEGVHTVAEWEPAYRDGHVLRDATDASGNVRTQLLWSRHAAGPLVSDRDFVVRQTRMQLPCGTFVVHTVSTAAHDAEAASVVEAHRRRGCVRAVLGDCGWVVRPIDSGSCHVTYIAQVDPKGSIPAWLVNQFASSMPMAIQRVRAVAQQRVARAAGNAARLASHPIAGFVDGDEGN